MLSAEQRGSFEAGVRAACESGDHESATTSVLEQYGPEILGYIHAVTRNETDAGDAFSLFSEDVWRGLPAFRWESSLRTWSYTVARHAISRLLRDPHRRPERRVPLSRSPVADIVEQVRTTTLEYLRTDVKDRVAQLREELDPDDQTLFILRISRRMNWTDIARIMSEDSEAGPEDIKRRAASLRKRFERAKNTLAKMVRERGLG